MECLDQTSPLGAFMRVFLDAFMRVFLDEISIVISDLSKVDYPHLCGYASFDLLRAWTEQTVDKGQIAPFILVWLLDTECLISFSLALRLGLTLLAALILRIHLYNWHLNSSLNCVGLLILKLLFNKYYSSTTLSVVGWTCGCTTVDIQQGV